jgi:hypothetical protein
VNFEAVGSAQPIPALLPIHKDLHIGSREIPMHSVSDVHFSFSSEKIFYF